MTVHIPPEERKSNLISIIGDLQGVQEAKKELLELASSMVNTNLISLTFTFIFHKYTFIFTFNAILISL